jgi:nicotinamidase-related amidase
MERTALVVVDVQKGFGDPRWPARNNPACEDNIAALVEAWRASGQPLVYVRHDSSEPGSPFTPGQPGNDFQDMLSGEPDLLVTKSVNSSFRGDPDLAAWLRGEGIGRVAVCGIQTNMCCESTARAAADLGFEVDFIVDATHTFDIKAHDGGTLTADEPSRVTASNIADEFGRVLSTREALAALAATAA